MFIWMVYSYNFPIIRFYFSFGCVPNEIEDSHRVIPRFPTPSTSYALLGGLGAALASGFVVGVSLALAGGVGSSDGSDKVRSSI